MQKGLVSDAPRLQIDLGQTSQGNPHRKGLDAFRDAFKAVCGIHIRLSTYLVHPRDAQYIARGKRDVPLRTHPATLAAIGWILW